MGRRIEYYRTSNGSCPVEEFLDSLNPKEVGKVYRVLKLIKDLDRVPAEFFKKLKGTEDIWECRIQYCPNAYRIFSFFFRGNTVVLTHGYSKKSRKADVRQIQAAEAYRREYLARNKGKSP